MKTTRQLSRRMPVWCAMFILAVFSAITSAQAASVTWTGGGGDDNWSNPSNWGGTAPSPGDLLFFAGSIRTTPVNDLPSGTVFNNIVFSSGASSFTLSGNSISLTNGNNAGSGAVSGGSITNSSTNAQTVNLAITILVGQHYITTASGAGGLNLSGAITRNTGATVSFVKSGGNINVTGSGLTTNGFNNILGGWASFGGVSSTDWATLDGSGNVIAMPSANYTIVAGAGAITSNPGGNVRVTPSGGNVTLAAAGTTELNSLIGAATAANQVVDVGAGKTLRLAARGGILNASQGLGTARVFTVGATAGQGTLTAGGADGVAGELFFCDTAFNSGSGNNLVINPVVANNGAGVVAVHILGYVQFNSVVNTYSGGTFINQGRVQAGGVNIFGTGPVYVFNGGHIFLNVGSGTWTNDFYISGFGSPESSGIGAIRMGGSRTISGTITLMGTASTGNGTVTGRITGPGGLIVGSGTANGSGTYTVGSPLGANDYAGDTQINNANPSPNLPNTLRMNASTPNIMPHGAGKGNVILNGVSATVTATLDLNGTAQTINGLSTIGSGANAFVTNSSATAATLTLGDNNANSTFDGSLRAGTGVLNLTKTGSGVITLSGANTHVGATTVSAGKLIVTTASTGGGSYAVADTATLGARVASAGASLNMSSLTLGSPCTVEIDPGQFGNPSAAPVNVVGDITVNGTVMVSVTRGDVGTFTLLQYSGTRSGAGAFVLGITPPRMVATLTDDIDNKRVTLTVTASDSSVSYVGDANGDWDINNPANLIWKGTSSGIITFYLENPAGNDTALFDDSATGTTIINLRTNLAPAGVIVSNNLLTYTFVSTGKLTSAATILNKRGTGTLIVDNTGTNDFGGGVVNETGTLQIGSGAARGNLPPGNVVNNAALTFKRSDAFTVASIISGSGTLTNDDVGVLTLSGGNSFNGVATVAQGTLKPANASALGTTNGETIVKNGATLDVNGINLGLEPVFVSGNGVGGNGAIINSGAQQLNALRLVTLTGDAKIGGAGSFLAANNPNRWDIRSNPTSSTNSVLSTGGNPFKLTKGGSNQISFVGTLVDSALGEIDIQGGLLGFETVTTSMGNPASTLTVRSGASLSFFNSTSLWDKVFRLFGDGVNPSVTNWSGSNTMIGPITLNNDCVFGVAGTTLVCNGALTGPGNLIKQGPSPLVLAGGGDYAGTTLVSNGTLYVNGNVVGGGEVRVYGGTLSGGGQIAGSVSIAANGTIAPGAVSNSIGFLEVDGSLQLGGTNVMDLNKTGAGLTSDALVFISDLSYGGTLRLNLTGDPLAPGDAFPLYSFASASGAFSTIIPSTPGTGLAWDTSQLAINGTLGVIDTTPPTITCPPAVTVQCEANIPLANFAGGIVTDTDPNPMITHVGDVASGSCPKIITRTYKAQDASGNMSTCTQTITVNDTTVPTITCPGALTVQCDAQVPPPNFAGGTVSDNCDLNPAVVHVGDSVSGSCPKTIVRTYKATDSCGNMATCTQTIIVNDTTAPTITCSTNLVVQSSGDTNGTQILFTVSAADNCDTNPVVICAPANGAYFTVGTNTVNCTATDTCGNSNICSFTVTVVVPPHPSIVSSTVSGTDLLVCGTNGTAGATYSVLTSTNVALPLDLWQSVATNQFNESGTFCFTNTVNPGSPQQFFLLRLP